MLLTVSKLKRVWLFRNLKTNALAKNNSKIQQITWSGKEHFENKNEQILVMKCVIDTKSC